MPAIDCTRLRRTFGDTVAVDGLDLQVRSGEIFGLVGPDGAGKTTTIRMLTGLLPPTNGRAVVAGCDVVTEASALRPKIGYMSQRFGLYADLTVLENLRFYADIQNVPPSEQNGRLRRLLEFSQLTDFQRRPAGQLSGGMKQKLGLACALIHTPQVLFLDEPTNGVDPVSRREFWRILYQLLQDGVTIFLSTAYLDEAERCNRLALLHQGRLIGLGTPDEVKRLMPGILLEVRTATPRRAAALLRERLTSATVGLFGDTVHIAGADEVELVRSIRHLLESGGLDLTEIRRISPSLEDVFVAALPSGVGQASSPNVP